MPAESPVPAEFTGRAGEQATPTSTTDTAPASRPPAGPTILHRLPTSGKLAITVLIVLAAVLTPPGLWPVHGLLACLVFVLHTLAEVPVGTLVRRLAVFLPVVGMVAISVPASQGFRAGWEIMQAILLRSAVALLAVFWLARVLPSNELLRWLSRRGVPAVLVGTLAFMYRYLFVLWDELERMRVARRSRSFGAGGLLFRWQTGIRLIGMLLIRSLDRATRVHRAMLARGWDGQVRFPDD